MMIATPVSSDSNAVRNASKRNAATQRGVHWGVVSSTALLCVAVAIVVHIVHDRNLDRTAHAILDRATSLEETGNWLAASDYVHRYLQLCPENSEQRIRLARVYGKAATSPNLKRNAVRLFYRAIAASPSEAEPLRFELCRLLLEIGRFVEAGDEAELLLSQDPANFVALRIKAIALFRQHQAGLLEHEQSGSVRIIESLEKARSGARDDRDLAVMLASSYRDEDLGRIEMADLTPAQRASRANDVIDDLVLACSGDPQALIVRHSYRVEYSLSGAEDDLQRALEMAPNDLVVLRVAAAAAHREAVGLSEHTELEADARSRFDQARSLYQKILDLNLAPDDPTATIALGEIYVSIGAPVEAIQNWRKGIEQFDRRSRRLFLARMADLWLDLGEMSDELASTLNMLDDELAQLPRTTRASELQAAQRDQYFRRGFWRLRRGEPQLAVPQLKQAILRQEQIGGESRQSSQAWLLLGTCHAALGEWTESAYAYDQAALQLPRSVAARTEASIAWLAANRVEMAVDRAEQAVGIRASAATWCTLAHACYRQQLQFAQGDRVWARCTNAISEAQRLVADGTHKDAWQIPVLCAEILLAKDSEKVTGQSSKNEAILALRRAEQEFSQQPRLWQSLVIFYEQLGEPQEADRALRTLKELDKGTLSLPTIESRLLTMRKQYDNAERALEEAIRNASSREKFALRREIARVKLIRNDLAGARSLLAELHMQSPESIAILRQLADIDMIAGRLNEVKRWEAMLESKGAKGAALASYFRAWRMLSDAKSPDDERLSEAANECAKVIGSWPTWGEVVALRGMIEQRRGALESAINSFEQAIALGDFRLTVFERLLGLLDRANRPADAKKYFERLKTAVPDDSLISGSQQLTELESSVELRAHESHNAIEIARRGVDQRPNDAAAHAWLGKLLAATKSVDEAELELRKAVELSPDELSNLNSLFTFYVGNRDVDQAKDVLTRIAKLPNLSSFQRLYLLAQGYESLGNISEAVGYYAQAVAVAPQNSSILLRLSALYSKYDPSAARECLEKALRLDPNSTIARRMLAITLGSTGDDSDWKRALSLLSSTAPLGAEMAMDNRLRAMILAKRGGVENWLRAAEILADLTRSSEQRDSPEYLVLAQVYENLAKHAVIADSENLRLPMTAAQYLTLCREQFIHLCARESPDPIHLTMFIQYLLRHELTEQADEWLTRFEQLLSRASNPSPRMISEVVRLRMLQGNYPVADRWLGVLEKSEPDLLPTVVLRARMMYQQGRRDEIAEFVDGAAERILAKVGSASKRKTALLGIGGMFSAIEDWPNAEKWYRSLYNESAEAFEPLVLLLARQKCYSQCFEICSDASSVANSAKIAMVASSIITSSDNPAELYPHAEAIISKALIDFPRDVELLNAVATMNIALERIGDAVTILRKVVEIDSRNIVAMNNLATLLSEDPKHRREALSIIESAIQIAGHEGALLDTKGTILLLDGNAERAVDFLNAAVAQGPPDPRHHFHLALAMRSLKLNDRVKMELQTAKRLDLTGQVLTPMERKLLEGMEIATSP